MIKEQVIEYLSTLSHQERFVLDKEVYEYKYKKESTEESREQKRNKREQDAVRKRDKYQAVGDIMKEIVKPGMVVKCRGTKDGTGIREVMEVNEYRITARKIRQQRRTMGTTMGEQNSYIAYYRDTYITTHEWNKVSKILDIKIEE